MWDLDRKLDNATTRCVTNGPTVNRSMWALGSWQKRHCARPPSTSTEPSSGIIIYGPKTNFARLVRAPPCHRRHSRPPPLRSWFIGTFERLLDGEDIVINYHVVSLELVWYSLTYKSCTYGCNKMVNIFCSFKQDPDRLGGGPGGAGARREGAGSWDTRKLWWR